MKKLIFPILILISSILHAQDAFTFGKKYGVMRLNNINRSVYAYNYARPWLTEKMPYFHYLQGYEASWQHRGDEIGFEMCLSRISESNIAFGKEPTGGLMGYRKIKIGFGGFSGGVTATILNVEHLEIVPALILDLNYFTGSTFYSNDAGFAGTKEEMVISNIKFASTIAVNFSFFATEWFGINIRPYFQQPWGKTNVEGLPKYFAGTSTFATQREKIRNFGINASIIFEFGRDPD